jgi:hypothetical protein
VFYIGLSVFGITLSLLKHDKVIGLSWLGVGWGILAFGPGLDREVPKLLSKFAATGSSDITTSSCRWAISRPWTKNQTRNKSLTFICSLVEQDVIIYLFSVADDVM